MKHNPLFQRGQGMTEYIILVSFIAIAAIGAYLYFGSSVQEQTASTASGLASGGYEEQDAYQGGAVPGSEASATAGGSHNGANTSGSAGGSATGNSAGSTGSSNNSSSYSGSSGGGNSSYAGNAPMDNSSFWDEESAQMRNIEHNRNEVDLGSMIFYIAIFIALLFALYMLMNGSRGGSSGTGRTEEIKEWEPDDIPEDKLPTFESLDFGAHSGSNQAAARQTSSQHFSTEDRTEKLYKKQEGDQIDLEAIERGDYDPKPDKN